MAFSFSSEIKMKALTGRGCVMQNCQRVIELILEVET